MNMHNIPSDLVPKIEDCAVTSDTFGVGCLYKIICVQMNDYFVRVGLFIIIFYIFLSWFLYWFFNKGYKNVKPKDTRFWRYIGNLEILETRVYWDQWIRFRMSKVMLGYIAIVVYMNW